MKQLTNRHGRLTIGFLTEHGFNEYQTQMMTGVFNATRKYDANVIRFGVKSIDYAKNYELTKLYDLIRLHKIDGLLFLGWMHALVINFEEFRERFKNIRLFSLGARYDDIPHIYMDGGRYLREMLLHLIEVHGYSRIVYVPPLVPDDRDTTYVETMKEYGIYRPELFLDREEINKVGVFAQRYKKIASLLFEEQRIAFDAIMTTYYEDAQRLLTELKERGIRVPEDVALTSYEDCDSARYNLPPITTIYYPWREIGYYGCESLIKLLQNKKVAFSCAVPGKIVIRNSCGCTANSIRLAKTGAIRAAEHALDKITPQEEREIITQVEHNFPDLTSRGFNVERLLKALTHDYTSETNSFLVSLQEQLEENIQDYSLVEGFDEVLYYFRQFVLPYLVSREKDLLWERDVFFQAQAIVKENLIISFGRRELRYRQENPELQEIGKELMTTFSITKLVDCLEDSLRKVSIKSCYLFLFLKGKSSNACRLVLHYSMNQRIVTDIELGNVADYLATNIYGRHIRSTLLVELLNVEDEFIGFVIYEPGPMDERIYNLLSVELSTALRGAQILENLVNTRAELIESAHRAGMADIASGTLHNVGNVLNSVNISLQLLKELAENSPVEDFEKACDLLQKNKNNIEDFFAHNPKGKQLLQFLLALKDSFHNSQGQSLYHLKRLKEKIRLIGDIIKAQQSYASGNAITEELDLTEALEDALRIHALSLEKAHIAVIKDYKTKETVSGQRTKLLQILINLLNNAKEAMENVPGEEKKITFSLTADSTAVYLKVTDNGCGIPEELIQTIFNLGFTTKRGGHGFGLHSCANYMTEMGGKIWVESQGAGKGSTFVLQFFKTQ